MCLGLFTRLKNYLGLVKVKNFNFKVSSSRMGYRVTGTSPTFLLTLVYSVKLVFSLTPNLTSGPKGQEPLIELEWKGFGFGTSLLRRKDGPL